jgi:hypothetical protein
MIKAHKNKKTGTISFCTNKPGILFSPGLTFTTSAKHEKTLKESLNEIFAKAKRESKYPTTYKMELPHTEGGACTIKVQASHSQEALFLLQELSKSFLVIKQGS